MYDGYGEVMRRCLELPEADVEDWIYGFTHAIWESGDADTEYARGHRKTPGRGIGAWKSSSGFSSWPHW